MARCVKVFVLLAVAAWAATPVGAQSIDLKLRFQVPVEEAATRYHRVEREESWQASETAVIVCDMWDAHHCVNAVRRVTELAPRIDQFCQQMRKQGATIIHAPSSCMDFYKEHPARLRSQNTTKADHFPEDIGSWCDQIPAEEAAAYPVDQSAGGEDDDLQQHAMWAERLTALGRNPRQPWIRQVATIGIDDEQDYISDNGQEIWSILSDKKIDNVILVGVHTNMCVLGRPFGLRRMAAGGKNTVLVRDLTDTMYDPRAWPYASHFTGTDLVISHVERYVCPTIGSDQILGGEELRFSADDRKRLVMLIAEDEYGTADTLPGFAAKHLSQHFSVSYAWGSADERNTIVGVRQLEHADAMLVSVRRRALPERDLQVIRDFVALGKPVIGIRTASHAFSLRGKDAPQGHSVWDEFDPEVFGGSYTNHYGNELQSTLTVLQKDALPWARFDWQAFKPGGSLYKVSPLADGARVLVTGTVPDEKPEPVAWTFVRADAGRSFYTSLGHEDDFAQPEFEHLLATGICWACDVTPESSLAAIRKQNERYDAGQGKQR